MAKLDLGTQGMTDEGFRADAGSRFSEGDPGVVDVSISVCLGRSVQPPFPAHEVNLQGITQGIRAGLPTSFQTHPRVPSIPAPTCGGARIARAFAGSCIQTGFA